MPYGVRAMGLYAAVLAFCGAKDFDAAALEWRSAHTVMAGAGSDSNLYMTAVNPNSAQSATASVAANVNGRQPGVSFDFAPEVRALRYRDDAEADRNDLFTRLGVTLDNSRRRLHVGQGYARESTLTSEFETSGLRADVERVQRDFDVAYSRTLSATRTFDIGASNLDTNYDDGAVSAYGDYAYRRVHAGTTKVVNARATWSLDGSRGFVDEAFRAGDSTTTALNSSWSVKLRPRLTGSFSIGAYVVDSVGAGKQDPRTSFSLGFSQEWLRWTASASVGRDVRPQAGGLLVVEETVALLARRQVAERVSIAFEATGAHTSSAIEQVRYQRDYARAGASVHWRISRRLDLDASVYQRVENASFITRATGLAGSVALTYRGG
jgi:hypothetical protein